MAAKSNYDIFKELCTEHEYLEYRLAVIADELLLIKLGERIEECINLCLQLGETIPSAFVLLEDYRSLQKTFQQISDKKVIGTATPQVELCTMKIHFENIVLN